MLVPAGGFATVAIAEPPGCVVTRNELLVAVPEEHPYVMAIGMPTSATSGSQERVATGAVVVPVRGIHCQPVIHAPPASSRRYSCSGWAAGFVPDTGFLPTANMVWVAAETVSPAAE